MEKSNRSRIYRNFDAMALIAYSPKYARHNIVTKVKKYRPENNAIRTESELQFEKLLNKIGIKYKREVPIPCDDRIYFVDFVIGQPYWIAAEIDGSSHNGRDVYDNQRDIDIMGLTGWTVLRFRNQEIGEVLPLLLAKTMNEILPIEKSLGNYPPKGHEGRLRTHYQLSLRQHRNEH